MCKNQDFNKNNKVIFWRFFEKIILYSYGKYTVEANMWRHFYYDVMSFLSYVKYVIYISRIFLVVLDQ